MNYPTMGNERLLGCRLTAFLASRTVPSGGVLRCYDWVTGLDPASDCVISGFQSPIERDVLRLLLQRNVPVVVALARRLYRDVPAEWQEAYDAGLLLLLATSASPRTSLVTARQRNEAVANMSSSIVMAFNAGKAGILHDLWNRLAAEGKAVRNIAVEEDIG